MSSRELIGVEIKFEKYDDVHEMVYLVDGVKEGSPAYNAGLGRHIGEEKDGGIVDLDR
jgi:hypothetical protein